MTLGPTQQLVLCALDEKSPRCSYEVAEYMAHYQNEAGWTGSTPRNEQPAAQKALVRLQRKGLVETCGLTWNRMNNWAITEAGRAAVAEASSFGEEAS